MRLTSALYLGISIIFLAIGLFQAQNQRQGIPYRDSVVVKHKDDLNKFLLGFGVSKQDLGSLYKQLNVNELKNGTKVYAEYALNQQQGNSKTLNLLTIYTNKTKVTMRSIDSKFAVASEPTNVQRGVVEISCKLKNSMLASGIAAGIPRKNLAELIDIYSAHIDFNRDVRGDKYNLTVLVEEFKPEHNEPYIGKTLFVSLNVKGQQYSAYLFKTEDGIEDFFDKEYKSIRRSLLQRPVKPSRITSKYGVRTHPLFGLAQMHNGVDFAAPIGSPVYAAGYGTIIEAKSKGSYGKYIKIRHGNNMYTAYAHLASFAADIGPGSRVKQGQVIGYVGKSGHSNGPHLHFEVLNGRSRVDPLKVKTFPIRMLNSRERARFLGQKAQIDRMIAKNESNNNA